MSFPGLLIEYLIAGGLALMWIVRLPLPAPIHLDYRNLGLLGVAAYTLGMLVDFIAYTILRRPKKWLRERTARQLGMTYRHASSSPRKVKFLLYAPEIVKEVEVRSSRDRIARDAWLNALFASVAWYPQVSWYVGVGVTVLCLAMWAFFETNSFAFELRAEQALNAKMGASDGPSS